MKRSIAAFWVVLRKELTDALRDRRTLATVLVSSVLMGPLVLLAISGLVASLESRAEQREVYVAGVANAPTLRNFLERQTYVVKEAPADFEARLRKSTFSDPVVVVPADFEAALVRALVHDPANIVLDEPTNGLDVLATRALRDSLRWLRSPEGGAKCIVFSTHIMQEVERLCDSVVVVAHGRTVATGTVPELLAETVERDFEEAFVKLAFVPERAQPGAAP